MFSNALFTRIRPLVVAVLNLNKDSFTQLKTFSCRKFITVKPMLRRFVCEGADVVDIGLESAHAKMRGVIIASFTLKLGALTRFNWFVLSLDCREYANTLNAIGYYSAFNYTIGLRDKRMLNLNRVVCCFCRLIRTKPFCALEAYDFFRLICKTFTRCGCGRVFAFDPGFGFLGLAQANFTALNVVRSLGAGGGVCLSRKRFLSLILSGDQDDLKTILTTNAFSTNFLFVRAHNVALTKLALAAAMQC
ncbi:MAG: hypothetical protein AAI978_00240 [Candidatus Hodgkinia cicadicola]